MKKRNNVSTLTPDQKAKLLKHSQNGSRRPHAGVSSPGKNQTFEGDAAPIEWPEPQPIIETSLRAVPPLPEALLPDQYRKWITDTAERIGCPVEYVATAAIVATGSVIGAGCAIHPKRRDDWPVVPNLWGGAVGRPGILLKTPALEAGISPLEQMADEASKAFEAAKKEFEGAKEVVAARQNAARQLMKEAANGRKKEDRGKKKDDRSIDMAYAKNEFTRIEKPNEPKWRRYKTNDATIEKLGELLSDNPRGLMLFRDELIGMLSQWERSGHEGDRAFFLESWNGTGSFDTDRIGRGSIHIPHACMSILGGIQPSRLLTYLDAAMRGADNDGLIQRFQLLVYPDEPEVTGIVDRFPDTDAKNNAYKIIQKLAEMDFEKCGTIVPEKGIPYFQFSDAAQTLFYEWYNDLTQKLRDEDQDIVAEHLSKFRKLMPALALIFHLIEIASGIAPGPIPESTARRAMAWCDFLEAHARRVYGLVGNLEIEASRKLAKHILNGKLGKRFTARDVYRRCWSLLGDPEVVERVCEYLIDQGWLREQRIETRGRSTKEYLVNPRLAERSAGELLPRSHFDENED